MGRARTASRVAPLLEAVQSVVGAPLYGHVFPVARGPGAGLILVAERRSLAWLSGRVEPEVQGVLVEQVRPGATFVDVGASIGFFTLLAGRLVGPGGSVVAFEPQRDAASSLRRNAALNGFAMVEVVETAVGAQTGEASLRGLGKATAYIVDDGEWDGGTLRVKTTTLDDHFTEPVRAPVMVKIDVEGHEREVLRGMTRLLEEASPLLVVETHGTADDVRADLARHRYETTPLGRSHLLCTPIR